MATMQNWTEGIVIMILFVVIFGVVIAGMNVQYNKSNKIIGLDTSGYEDTFKNYNDNIKEKTTGGEASFLGSVGLVLGTSWDMIKTTFGLIGNFISGRWLRTIVVDYMKLPEEIGFWIQTLYLMSLGFIILKILFKIKV